jgi:hypothetical protein
MNGRPREPIMRALKEALAKIPEFNSVTRRIRASGDFNPTDFPILMIDELSETCNQGEESSPEKTTFNIEMWVMINNGQDLNEEPISALNTLLDKIDIALAPAPYQNTCTLGGLVSHCWVDGTIDKQAGDIGGIGIARIPLKILIP